MFENKKIVEQRMFLSLNVLGVCNKRWGSGVKQETLERNSHIIGSYTRTSA